MAKKPAPQTPSTPTMVHTRTLYLRALGLVCLAAFLSLWWQVEGLIGPRGILPLDQRLSALAPRLDAAPLTGVTELDRLLRVPTLSWFLPTAWAPHLLAALGTLGSCLLLAGRYQGQALLVIWASYLSLTVDGSVFLSFQWDSLLVEVAFASMLVAPWRRQDAAQPPPWAWWLLRWILFRLIFFAGVVKLTSGDTTWRDLSAMTYHYLTQPIPNPISWWMHALPAWLHSLEAVAMFAIELLGAWLILGTRRARTVAFGGVLLLMGMLFTTGNYGFFQILTMVLALSLLDDEHWLRLVPMRQRTRFAPPAAPAAGPLTQGLTGLVAAVLFLTSLVGLPHRYMRVELPKQLETWRAATAPFRTVNHYGLFAVMTTRRPIPVLEVRWGDAPWTELTWRWQPTDPAAAPPYLGPHMPRVDWRLWFAGLGSCDRNPWATVLLQRVVEGSEPVRDLVGDLRLLQRPPDAARLRLYEYDFTAPGSEAALAGDWWTRTPKGQYCPPVTRPR